MPNSATIEYLESPNKSENDKKQYKLIRLPNELLALLVSDPSPKPEDSDSSSSSEVSDSENEETSEEEVDSLDSTDNETTDSESEYEGDEKLAACALMVDVGSFSDPPEINGMAHFLEHMIFMGSEKFPKENEFDIYVKKCGGFANAHTEFDETIFYLEIAEEYLDGALDIFTALFKNPLLKKEAMTRERNAVDSEFKSSLQDEEHRKTQILASLASKDSPARVFSWGNKITLEEGVANDTLHTELIEFRKKHYSAHRMYVCVQARLPMETLEDMVVKHFAQIPNNHLPPDDFSQFNNENSFEKRFHEEVFFVKPVGNSCTLDLTWVFPSMIKEYREKPCEYIDHLIGYEGSGSLLAYLKRRLWALELVVGIDDSSFDFNSMYSLFNICISLTEDGFNHLNEVLSATFSYLKLLQLCGPNKELYHEFKDIGDTAFKFHSEKSALDVVENLVLDMKYFPPKDILTGREIFFNYDEAAIRRVITLLNKPNFNIMLTTNFKYDGVTFDKKEEWFGTEYATLKFPNEWTTLWENAKPIPELFLPEPNVFISRDFTILWKENGMPLLPQYPKKLVDTEVCDVWFKQDDKFQLPYAHLYFYIITPMLRSSAKNDVLLALYSLLLNHHLNEKLYPAVDAGLEYTISSSEKGLVLKVEGYNEKLHLIVDIVTKLMPVLIEKVDEDQLHAYLEEHKKNLYMSLLNPKMLNRDIRLSITQRVWWPTYDKYNFIKSITLDDLKQFSTNLFSELRIQGLIQGNIAEDMARNVVNTILSNLNCGKISNPKIIEDRARQLPVGRNLVQCKTFNKNDVNSVVLNYYQIGPCTLRKECILDLLLMLIEEPLFDTLRTKEQLGYDVSITIRNTLGILGYTICVVSQECTFQASYVEERIEAFRFNIIDILENLEEDVFEQTRDSLIKLKNVIDNKLKEEVCRNWEEITSQEYIFDRQKQAADCLKTITKTELINFCINEEKNLRKLSIQVIGNISEDDRRRGDAEEELTNLGIKYITDGDSILNINAFRESLFVFPVVKTILTDVVIENNGKEE